MRWTFCGSVTEAVCVLAGLHSSNLSDQSKPTVVGAAPEGANDPQSAALAVREMFTSIAPRYDLLNHLLSFNVDRLWWMWTARNFTHILARPEAQVLDLCCGTGDMAFALRRQAGKSAPHILGTDFSHAMLQRADEKSAGMSTRCACPSPTRDSTWSRRRSASVILLTTTLACVRSCASCAREENAAFWISASPAASSGSFTGFTSSVCCLR